MSFTIRQYLDNSVAKVKIKPMTLDDAKRLQPDIYEALMAELYFEGCLVCAKYFEYLICEENELIRDKFISKRMESNKPVLIKLFDTCKAAEQVSRLKNCLSRKSCYQLLYQCLNISKTLPEEFGWLQKSLFDIIIEVADTYGRNDILCCEIRAKIYTKYAMRQLKSKMCHVRYCVAGIRYFDKALSLCRGQDWRTDNITKVFDEYNLHEFVGISFAKLLTLSAMLHLRRNPKLGLQQADRSIKCIAEVSQLEMKILVMKAILAKSRLLMELEQFKEAMKQLRAAERYATGEKSAEFQKVRCEINICKGVCYENLALTPFALIKLKLSCSVARLLNVPSLIGSALLQTGKIYMKIPAKYELAEKALEGAREAFAEGSDEEDKKCTKYMIATLQALKNGSQFEQMIKDSKFKFCELYKIRKWKDQLCPYWKRRALTSFIKSYSSSLSLVSTKTTLLALEEDEVAEEMSSMEDSETESQGYVHVAYDPIQCLLNEAL